MVSAGRTATRPAGARRGPDGTVGVEWVMSVIVKKGDIFDEPVEALVNPVNCEGAAGRGLARAFRDRFPSNYREYRVACARRELDIGRLFVYETGLAQPLYIVNFPTKRQWRSQSRLGYIDAGLGDLIDQVQRHSIRSLALPALGCGLGGLDWQVVMPLIVKAALLMPEVRVTVFEPGDAP